jgi:hypothetical protein
VIDSNKPAICKDGPLRFGRGRLRVVRMGDSDMEFRHTQGLGGTRSSDRGCRRRLCSTIGVASANRLTEGCNGPGCGVALIEHLFNVVLKLSKRSSGSRAGCGEAIC